MRSGAEGNCGQAYDQGTGFCAVLPVPKITRSRANADAARHAIRRVPVQRPWSSFSRRCCPGFCAKPYMRDLLVRSHCACKNWAVTAPRAGAGARGRREGVSRRLKFLIQPPRMTSVFRRPSARTATSRRFTTAIQSVFQPVSSGANGVRFSVTFALYQHAVRCGAALLRHH